MDPNTPCVRFPHYFFSATWTKGDEQSPLRLGPLQDAPRPWREGRLGIRKPPGVPYGQQQQFANGLDFPTDVNVYSLYDGITAQCWISTGVPFQPFNVVSDISNCCVVQAYARIIDLLYDDQPNTIDQFFFAWLGPAAVVTNFPEAGLIPAMTIVVTGQYALVFCSGTTNFQQIALQASEGALAPVNNGGIATMPVWFDLATTITTRLDAVGASVAAPIVLVGHSYGAAGCAVAAVRMKEAAPAREVRLMTFGMPKPGDQTFVNKMQDLIYVLCVNDGDVVPCLPINAIQSTWYPFLVSALVALRWSRWIDPPLIVLIEEDGTRTPGPTPSLGSNILLPLVTKFVTGQPVPVISQHPIKEYIRRLKLGCTCPRTPFDQEEWVIIFPPIAEAQLGLRDPPIAADVGVVSSFVLDDIDIAAGAVGMSALPILDIGLVAVIPSAGSIGLTGVAVRTGEIGVLGLDVATGEIGVHDYRAELLPGGSVGLAAVPPALESSDDGLGLAAPQASVSTIGLTWIGEFEPWAVGAVGLIQVTPAAAGIGISGEVAGGFTIGIVAADVPAGADVGLTFIEFEPWATGGIGLDGGTPGIGQVGLVGEQPIIPGYTDFRVRVRSAMGFLSHKSAGFYYYDGEWYVYVWDLDPVTGGYDEVQISAELGAWYDLVIVDDGVTITASIGSDTASWTASGENTRTAVVWEFNNDRFYGNTPFAVESLTVSSVASGLVWSDNFVDPDGTLSSDHTPDLSPGGAGYLTLFSSPFQIMDNLLVVGPAPPIEDFGSVFFDPGEQSAVSVVTTVLRLRIASA